MQLSMNMVTENLLQGHSIYLMIILKRIKPRLMQILLQGLKLLKVVIHDVLIVISRYIRDAGF